MKLLNEQTNKFESMSISEYAKNSADCGIFEKRGRIQDIYEAIKSELAGNNTMQISVNEINKLAKMIMIEQIKSL